MSKVQTIICTSRIKDAEHFYGTVLGLSLKGRSLGSLVYQVGNSTIRVSPVQSMQPSEHTILGFAVADLRDVIKELRARGLELERFTNFSHDDDGVVRIPDGTQVAWFRDPDRNLLSVVQYCTEDGISS
jgi:catechol 2,3-dioxygenase-like lactoylglutathione lyase family enzyme